MASDTPVGQVSAETLRDDPLVGQALDGKYELLERLGEGGMGVVYRAGRVHIGDEVAVKVLLRKFVADMASVERFRREARAAARLRHQNVVAIYDYGEARGDDAPAYIVMELLEGISLRRLLQREGWLAPERAVALMRDICAGVGSAHRRGVFHRDLKPDNVIVLSPNEDRERESVKVVDFGIAKLRDPAGAPTLTQTGALVGTPYYMSPEQCRGEPLDARSDVYSLGAMLYEMLAGTPPFTAETATGVMAKHLFDPPPPLPPKLGVASPVEEVVMRALAKEADSRPADATTLARELQEAEYRGREEEARRRAEEELRRAEEERQQAEAEAMRRAEEEAARRREEEERRSRQAAAAAQAAEEQRLREAGERAAEEQRRLEEVRREEAERRHREEEERKRLEAEESERRRAQAAARAKREAEESERAGREAAETSPLETSPLSAAAAPTDTPLPLPSGEGRWRLMLIAISAAVVVTVIAAALLYRPGVTPSDISGPARVADPTPSPAGASPTQAPTAPPAGMVFVRGGKFSMGRDDGDEFERPARTVEVKPFFIDAYEVTCGDYAKFVRDTGRQPPPGWKSACPPASARKPVGVTWDDATAYCQYVAGKRLPTEEEWEFAARGEDGRRYPWGNDWLAGAANAEGASRDMVDVGSYQAGVSPFGAFDMVGNAWEWTASDMAAYPGGKLPEEPPAGMKVLRGGSYKSSKNQATATYRFGWRASGESSYANTGFRCVKDIAESAREK